MKKMDTMPSLFIKVFTLSEKLYIDILKSFDFRLYLHLAKYSHVVLLPQSHAYISKISLYLVFAAAYLMRPGLNYLYKFDHYSAPRSALLLLFMGLILVKEFMTPVPISPLLSISAFSTLGYCILLFVPDVMARVKGPWAHLNRARCLGQRSSTARQVAKFAYVSILCGSCMCLLCAQHLSQTEMWAYAVKLLMLTTALLALIPYLKQKVCRGLGLAFTPQGSSLPSSIIRVSGQHHIMLNLSLLLVTPIYAYAIYMPFYLVQQAKCSAFESPTLAIVCLVLVFSFIGPIAYLSKRIGHLKFLYLVCTVATLFGYSLCDSLRMGSSHQEIASSMILIYSLIFCLTTPMIAIFVERLPSKASPGLILNYIISVAPVLSLITLLLVALHTSLNQYNWAGLYMSCAGLLGLFIIQWFQSHQRQFEPAQCNS